jgi:superfamily I DNA/RNA helicase
MLVKPEDWEVQGVEGLEDRAWDALRETTRSVCVTAGAGAGKTEFLAQKAAYLLQTGLCPAPRKILAISFKRDAAENLAERVRRRCPDQGHRFVSLTFDAFTKGLVDQFRDAIPEPYRPPLNYEITFPNRDIVEDFLKRNGASDVSWQGFERALANTSLPLDEAGLSPRALKLMTAYWEEQYAGPDRFFLTFAMINRLVEFLVRTNDRIRNALLATYPVVFLDEFQDTTNAQFQVVASTFHGSQSVLTAVGDDKQRIMVWAGAMKDSFKKLTKLFDARSITLLSNWRSHEDLVAIQHLIARKLDPEVEEAVAKRNRQVDGNVAAIWVSDTRDDEIEDLARWVAAEIENGGVQPHRIAILVRNRADQLEEELLPAFEEHGIALRNVARNIGGVAIQDILSEELTELTLQILRLGAQRRAPESWARAIAIFQALQSIPDSDEVELQRLTRKLETICRSVRQYMKANQPGDLDAGELTEIVIAEIGEADIRQATPSYSRDADFARIKKGFTALLSESCAQGGSWSEALDRFEGIGQVPLMTVHKSKGLEFHSMIFFGLDSQSWWSLKPDNTEELSSFFVALTRAEQRAFFTCCSQRGGRIAWLEDILGDAVPRLPLGQTA